MYIDIDLRKLDNHVGIIEREIRMIEQLENFLNQIGIESTLDVSIYKETIQQVKKQKIVANGKRDMMISTLENQKKIKYVIHELIEQL